MKFKRKKKDEREGLILEENELFTPEELQALEDDAKETDHKIKHLDVCKKPFVVECYRCHETFNGQMRYCPHCFAAN